MMPTWLVNCEEMFLYCTGGVPNMSYLLILATPIAIGLIVFAVVAGSTDAKMPIAVFNGALFGSIAAAFSLFATAMVFMAIQMFVTGYATPFAIVIAIILCVFMMVIGLGVLGS